MLVFACSPNLDSSPDSGVTDALEQPDGGDFGPRLQGRGTVFLDSAETGSTLAAYFLDQPCTVEGTLGCRVWTCPGAGSSVPHAGTITATVGTTQLVIDPGTDGRYSPATGPMPSGSVHMQAAGGSLSPFDVTVTAPAKPTIDPLPTAISRSHDLKVTWQGGGAGSMEVLLATTSSGGAEFLIQCFGPQSAGSFTMPAALIQRLSPAFTGAELGVYADTHRFVTDGDYEVRVAAFSEHQTPTVPVQP
jgi:hypothetical protein